MGVLVVNGATLTLNHYANKTNNEMKKLISVQNFANYPNYCIESTALRHIKGGAQSDIPPTTTEKEEIIIEDLSTL